MAVADQLQALLAKAPAGPGPLEEDLGWLERAGHWVAAKPPAERLELLVAHLERTPDARARVAACFERVLAGTSALRLLAQVGLPNDRGLVQETGDRLARRFLPAPPDPTNLGELLARTFRKERHAVWLAELPLDILSRLVSLLGDVWGPVRASMFDAIALLTTRVAALGLTEGILDRSPVRPVRESPFHSLPHVAFEEMPRIISACRQDVQLVYATLESSGVSVDVVYCLDTIERALDRIQSLLPLVGATNGNTLAASRDLVAKLTAARLEERSLRRLFGDNVRLLARKVIERAGETGEHYVTATRREYFLMLASAGGGGVVTAGTIVGKFLVKWGHFPLFVEGALSSVVYAASFILIQLLGFTLATKQPSMTAAALAGSIGGAKDHHDLYELVTLISRISRSQLAAAIGNMTLVTASALLFGFLYRNATGAEFLSAADAEKVLASMHPWESGTLFYGALTGVLLWMSSLGAGAVENWSTYYRLPEAIEFNRAGRKFFGRRTTAALARFYRHHIAGFGGNITLGVLLGMTPVLGAFFGLPLDVRHVTLSTGTVALAVTSLGTETLGTHAFLMAAAGILVTLALNFGVSFALALMVALRARDITPKERWTFLKALGLRLLKSPMEFLYPTRTAIERTVRVPTAH